MKRDNRNSFLGKIYDFQYGTGNTIENIGGDYPIYGSNGPVGFTNKYNSEDAPIIGHIGAYAGIVNWGKGKHYVTYNGVICKIKDRANSNFGYYTLINSNLQKRVRGSTQPFVSYDLLEEIPIFLPDIQEQKKIADVLSALDDKIELNNKINAELEEMAKLLYDYWFVQFDFPNAEGKPYKSSEGKMVWSDELNREIPEGREVMPINKKVKIGSGFPFASKDYVSEGKYKIITITNVQDGVLDTNKVNYINFIPESIQKFSILNVGDVLISLTGNVGRMCFVDQENLLLNQRVGKLIGEDEYTLYVYLFFLRPENRKKIEQIAGGSSQANLSPIDVVKSPFYVPPEKVLNDFYKLLSPIYKKLINNKQENQQLAELRDRLLPMLMNGQVTVK